MEYSENCLREKRASQTPPPPPPPPNHWEQKTNKPSNSRKISWSIQRTERKMHQSDSINISQHFNQPVIDEATSTCIYFIFDKNRQNHQEQETPTPPKLPPTPPLVTVQGKLPQKSPCVRYWLHPLSWPFSPSLSLSDWNPTPPPTPPPRPELLSLTKSENRDRHFQIFSNRNFLPKGLVNTSQWDNEPVVWRSFTMLHVNHPFAPHPPPHSLSRTHARTAHVCERIIRWQRGAPCRPWIIYTFIYTFLKTFLV